MVGGLRNFFLLISALGIFFVSIDVVYAHDGWIQTNVARVDTGDMVYVDMPFGNHGNMHRDYLIWPSKWDIQKASFTLIEPDSTTVDMKEEVIDVGYDSPLTFCNGTTAYTDKNGYLVTSFIADQPGIYIMDVRQDVVVSYAPERSVKCTKAIVGSLDPSKKEKKKTTSLPGYDRILGQELEVVPLDDPTNLAVGDTLDFQVLFKGEPFADAEISVIPRGTVLPSMGTPNPYDIMSDEEGMASYTFTEANYHLIVVHAHTNESGVWGGKSYSMAKYTGDLTVIVRPGKPVSGKPTAQAQPGLIDGVLNLAGLLTGSFFDIF